MHLSERMFITVIRRFSMPTITASLPTNFSSYVFPFVSVFDRSSHSYHSSTMNGEADRGTRRAKFCPRSKILLKFGGW